MSDEMSLEGVHHTRESSQQRYLHVDHFYDGLERKRATRTKGQE